MRDLAQAESFTDAEQDRFEYLVRHFLAGKCFVRKKSDATDEYWRFILHYQGVLAAYFAVAGWEFEVHQGLGAAVARPTQRKHAQLFSLIQTHLVYNLLHAHYEATTGGDLDHMDELKLTFGEVLERIERSVPRGTKINHDSIRQACKKLRNFGAISLPRGFAGDAHELVTIYPVIELVIPRAVVERSIQAIGSTEAPSELVPSHWAVGAQADDSAGADHSGDPGSRRDGAGGEDAPTPWGQAFGEDRDPDEDELDEDGESEDEDEDEEDDGPPPRGTPQYRVGSLLEEFESRDDDIMSEVMRDD